MQVDPERLPHWTRVAFAARCARRVQPLFAEAWPDATPGRVEAVERAIVLAEQSAAEQMACDGLKDAVLGAVMAAGRTCRTKRNCRLRQFQNLGFHTNRTKPSNQTPYAISPTAQCGSCGSFLDP